MKQTETGREKASADDPFAGFSQEVVDAWKASFMASVPNEIVRAMLANARETSVPAGRVFYRGAYHDQMAMLALVAEGLLRIYLVADNGRQVTLHYMQPGDIVGAPALLLAGAQSDSEQARQPWKMLGGRRIHGEAVRDTVLLRLSPAQFLRLVRTEVSVAWPLSTFLARQSVAAQQILSDDMFLPVHARVARHLVNLAVRQGDEFVVTASHQEIADAVGSVREVVSRALGEMREDGLIERRGNCTVLTDVGRLRSMAGHGLRPD
jgi:CRP-like cAMP-binding protein